MIPGLEPPIFSQLFFGTIALFIISAGMLLSLYIPLHFLDKSIDLLMDLFATKPPEDSDMTQTQYRIYPEGQNDCVSRAGFCIRCGKTIAFLRSHLDS